MRSTRGAAGADGPLAPGSADRARAGRGPARRGRRRLTALALAAGALALAVAGAPGTAGTATGSGGGPRTGHAAPGGPVGGPRDAPADPVALAASAASAAPERCADGSLVAASLRPSGAAGEAVRRIQRSGQLVVGVDQNSFLWGYRDPHTGALEGFDIDLVGAIARDLLGEDPSIVYRTIPTDQRIPALRDRRVDLVVRTMTVNCDRRADVAFSTAYFEAGQQVLAPRASDVTGYDASLTGRTVCTARGSTGQSALEADNPGARVVLVPNQLDCLVRLQLGEVDAVVTDSALAAGQAAQDPTVALVGEPFTTEYYGVAMNLADEDLVRRVNRVLDDFRSGGADSAWRASYERWLDDVMPGRDPSPPTPRYRD
ncbi:glutamate ABC transporter substrate-binding protein [Streptomyces sp. TRM70308]|uniref:glutamate ABC transporter substrate-binding protein n=1 Tax=Streptomyces sp. TRM70308 TaxID=3131932 RepID=UPI003CFBCD68